ncbi:MAG: alpha/beta hydrolase fold domain-containing protein [Bacteroidota bacterium]
MKLKISNFFWLPFVLSTIITYGQERYKDSLFSTIKVSTYTYADTLQLDFYSSTTDTIQNRPLLLLVHGGGFAFGKKDNPLEKAFCTQMAYKGYAVASMSYRLTRKGKSFGCDCPANQKITTFKTATEDVVAAVNYLANRKNELKIDPGKIILVGSSAGAEAVLNTVFMPYHHDFKDISFPKEKFAGVIAFAGAVLDTDYITKETRIPALLYHGKKDKLVPFKTAPHHYCDTNAEGYLILSGSYAIAKKLAVLNTSYVFMFDTEGNHDWANLPYTRTDEISAFITDIVLEGRFTQSKIQIAQKQKDAD